jgi:hypothetical protein
VGRFEDPAAPDAGPLDHTLKPRSGNGGACSSLTAPKLIEEVAVVPPSGAFKKRCAARQAAAQQLRARALRVLQRAAGARAPRLCNGTGLSTAPAFAARCAAG